MVEHNNGSNNNPAAIVPPQKGTKDKQFLTLFFLRLEKIKYSLVMLVTFFLPSNPLASN